MVCSVLIPSFLATVAALAPAGFANGWQKLANQPAANASTMFLLMDGRVLMNDWESTRWWLLTPDANGSYLNGTWSPTADSIDDRLYFASAVLANGRVIVSGGEYSNTGGFDKTEVYDPLKDKWTKRPTLTGWTYVGDAPSIVLADGRFMMGNIQDGETAIYDPSTSSWTAAATKLNGQCVEETWTLLPDGTFVTADCVNHPGSELYDPVADAWVDLGNTPVDIVDSSLEVGAGLLMYDGRAFCLGATTHTLHYKPSTTPSGVGT